MQLSIERIRLSFPLDLVIEHSQVITEQGDTLLHSEELHLDIALNPLLKKQVKVNLHLKIPNSLIQIVLPNLRFQVISNILYYL